MDTSHISVSNQTGITFKKPKDYNDSCGLNGKIDVSKIARLKQGLQFKSRPDLPHISQRILKTKKICGIDSRETADNLKLPFCMVCNLIITLKDNQSFRASGFFISPRCVITAGHCVYLNKEWAQKIEVIPGDKSMTRPLGSDISTTFQTVEGWVHNEDDNYDYGAVILKNDDLFTVINSYFGYTQYLQDENLYNSGYPHDYYSIQKHSSGKAESDPDKQVIKYNIDTYSGNSGSPVFIKKDNQFMVVGVHTFGQCPNHAVKVTDEVISNWNNWSRNM